MGNSRRYAVNEQFFDAWSPEMAYVLGWMASDGCVVHSKGKPTALTINIVWDDIDVLRSIAKLMEYEGPIYGPKKPKRGRPQAQFFVTSRKLAERLVSLGLTQHKSHDLQWLDYIPAEHLHHFVRGYFDGDGCIYTGQASHPLQRVLGVKFVGTEAFIKGLQETVGALLGLKGHYANRGTWTDWALHGKNVAMKILEWMYTDSTPETRLERKWTAYQNFLDYINLGEGMSYVGMPISYDLAEEIRSRYLLGKSVLALSREFGVTRDVVANAVKGRTYQRADNRDSRSEHYFTAWGETKHWKDWLKDPRCVVGESTLFDRLVKRQADPELAISTPADKGVTLWGGDKRYGQCTGKTTHVFTLGGETKSLLQWSKDPRCLVSYPILHTRVVKQGMDLLKAMTTPPGKAKTAKEAPVQSTQPVPNPEPVRKKSDVIYLTYNGETHTIREWSEILGIPYSTIDRRYRMGLPIEQVMAAEGGRLNLGKAKSARDEEAYRIAQLVREDYKNGIVGKANYEQHGIPKSRYIDLIGNRTCKEDTVWWKDAEASAAEA